MLHRARILVVASTVAGCGYDQPKVEPVLTESSTEHTGGSSSSGAGDSSSSSSSSSSSADAGMTDSGESTAGSSEATVADTSEASSAADTSSGPAPFCGDGHVDRDKGEECDDGEGISDTCVLCSRVRLIFLTSTLLQGGKINGLMGADAYCRSLALKAKTDIPDSPIVDPKNFKALLSTSTESIADRHFFGEGPYRLVNGLQVSRSFEALFSEPHDNPINVDERSQTLHGPVWTGTDIDGEPYPGINFCGDWKDNQGTANFGHSDYVDSWWIHADIDLNPDGDCYSELPIYCVEQE